MTTAAPQKRNYKIRQGTTWTDSFVLYIGTTALTWAASTAYVFGDCVVPPLATGKFYRNHSGAGTSSSLQPPWSYVDNEDVEDNDITWITQPLATSSSFASYKPLDLTNASAIWQVRLRAGADPIWTLTEGADDGITLGTIDGTVAFTLTPELSAALEAPEYEHDLLITLGVDSDAGVAGSVITPIEGTITTGYAISVAG